MCLESFTGRAYYVYSLKPVTRGMKSIYLRCIYQYSPSIPCFGVVTGHPVGTVQYCAKLGGMLQYSDECRFDC